MQRDIIRGDRIYLRPLRLSDVTEEVFGWLKDADVVKYIESPSPKSIKGLKSFYKKIIKDPNNRMYGIFLADNGRHIGNIKLGGINRKHGFSDIAIMIGAKGQWGKGYCQEAMRILVGYAFNRLRLHKLFLSVCERNKAAVRAYEKVGFKSEGRLENLYKYGGRYFDRLYMGITK